MKLRSLALIGALSLLSAFQSTAYAAKSKGWLIYSNPREDKHYGQIQGQARQIRLAYIKPGDNKVVLLSDEGGYTVPVTFISASRAKAFLAGVKKGKSVDVTECRQKGRFASEQKVSYRCIEKTYRAEFACGLTDSEEFIRTWSIDEEKYQEANPRELALYLSQIDCLHGMTPNVR